MVFKKKDGTNSKVPTFKSLQTDDQSTYIFEFLKMAKPSKISVDPMQKIYKNTAIMFKAKNIQEISGVRSQAKGWVVFETGPTKESFKPVQWEDVIPSRIYITVNPRIRVEKMPGYDQSDKTKAQVAGEPSKNQVGRGPSDLHGKNLKGTKGSFAAGSKGLENGVRSAQSNARSEAAAESDRKFQLERDDRAIARQAAAHKEILELQKENNRHDLEKKQKLLNLQIAFDEKKLKADKTLSGQQHAERMVILKAQQEEKTAAIISAAENQTALIKAAQKKAATDANQWRTTTRHTQEQKIRDEAMLKFTQENAHELVKISKKDAADNQKAQNLLSKMEKARNITMDKHQHEMKKIAMDHAEQRMKEANELAKMEKERNAAIDRHAHDLKMETLKLNSQRELDAAAKTHDEKKWRDTYDANEKLRRDETNRYEKETQRNDQEFKNRILQNKNEYDLEEKKYRVKADVEKHGKEEETKRRKDQHQADKEMDERKMEQIRREEVSNQANSSRIYEQNRLEALKHQQDQDRKQMKHKEDEDRRILQNKMNDENVFKTLQQQHAHTQQMEQHNVEKGKERIKYQQSINARNLDLQNLASVHHLGLKNAENQKLAIEKENEFKTNELHQKYNLEHRNAANQKLGIEKESEIKQNELANRHNLEKYKFDVTSSKDKFMHDYRKNDKDTNDYIILRNGILNHPSWNKQTKKQELNKLNSIFNMAAEPEEKRSEFSSNINTNSIPSSSNVPGTKSALTSDIIMGNVIDPNPRDLSSEQVKQRQQAILDQIHEHNGTTNFAQQQFYDANSQNRNNANAPLNNMHSPNNLQVAIIPKIDFKRNKSDGKKQMTTTGFHKQVLRSLRDYQETGMSTGKVHGGDEFKNELNNNDNIRNNLPLNDHNKNNTIVANPNGVKMLSLSQLAIDSMAEGKDQAQNNPPGNNPPPANNQANQGNQTNQNTGQNANTGQSTGASGASGGPPNPPNNNNTGNPSDPANTRKNKRRRLSLGNPEESQQQQQQQEEKNLDQEMANVQNGPMTRYDSNFADFNDVNVFNVSRNNAEHSLQPISRNTHPKVPSYYNKPGPYSLTKEGHEKLLQRKQERAAKLKQKRDEAYLGVALSEPPLDSREEEDLIAADIASKTNKAKRAIQLMDLDKPDQNYRSYDEWKTERAQLMIKLNIPPELADKIFPVNFPELNNIEFRGYDEDAQIDAFLSEGDHTVPIQNIDVNQDIQIPAEDEKRADETDEEYLRRLANLRPIIQEERKTSEEPERKRKRARRRQDVEVPPEPGPPLSRSATPASWNLSSLPPNSGSVTRSILSGTASIPSSDISGLKSLSGSVTRSVLSGTPDTWSLQPLPEDSMTATHSLLSDTMLDGSVLEDLGDQEKDNALKMQHGVNFGDVGLGHYNIPPIITGSVTVPLTSIDEQESDHLDQIIDQQEDLTSFHQSQERPAQQEEDEKAEEELFPPAESVSAQVINQQEDEQLAEESDNLVDALNVENILSPAQLRDLEQQRDISVLPLDERVSTPTLPENNLPISTFEFGTPNQYTDSQVARIEEYTRKKKARTPPTAEELRLIKERDRQEHQDNLEFEAARIMAEQGHEPSFPKTVPMAPSLEAITIPITAHPSVPALEEITAPVTRVASPPKPPTEKDIQQVVKLRDEFKSKLQQGRLNRGQAQVEYDKIYEIAKSKNVPFLSLDAILSGIPPVREESGWLDDQMSASLPIVAHVVPQQSRPPEVVQQPIVAAVDPMDIFRTVPPIPPSLHADTEMEDSEDQPIMTEKEAEEKLKKRRKEVEERIKKGAPPLVPGTRRRPGVPLINKKTGKPYYRRNRRKETENYKHHSNSPEFDVDNLEAVFRYNHKEGSSRVQKNAETRRREKAQLGLFTNIEDVEKYYSYYPRTKSGKKSAIPKNAVKQWLELQGKPREGPLDIILQPRHVTPPPPPRKRTTHIPIGAETLPTKEQLEERKKQEELDRVNRELNADIQSNPQALQQFVQQQQQHFAQMNQAQAQLQLQPAAQDFSVPVADVLPVIQRQPSLPATLPYLTDEQQRKAQDEREQEEEKQRHLEENKASKKKQTKEKGSKKKKKRTMEEAELQTIDEIADEIKTKKKHKRDKKKEKGTKKRNIEQAEETDTVLEALNQPLPERAPAHKKAKKKKSPRTTDSSSKEIQPLNEETILKDIANNDYAEEYIEQLKTFEDLPPELYSLFFEDMDLDVNENETLDDLADEVIQTGDEKLGKMMATLGDEFTIVKMMVNNEVDVPQSRIIPIMQRYRKIKKALRKYEKGEEKRKKHSDEY